MTRTLTILTWQTDIYARVKNVAKGEDVIKDDTNHNYAFVDEFLEESMKISSIILHLPENFHISILDGGADTCV
jgi:phosphoserine aminotransferase